MEKRKRGKGKLIVGGAAILALLGLGAGLKFGSGSGLGIFSNATVPAMSQTNPAETEPVVMEPEKDEAAGQTQGEQNPQQIRVSESDIYLGEESVTLDALKDKLLSAYDGATPWELTDDHARKAEYDAVKALLSELDMAFIEQ